jgi:hypothetical protein
MDHVFKGRYDIAEAQIIQDDFKELRVLVVPSNEWNDGDSRQRLRRELEGRLGSEMNIQIEITDQISRESNGKLRAVKSSIHGARA